MLMLELRFPICETLAALMGMGGAKELKGYVRVWLNPTALVPALYLYKKFTMYVQKLNSEPIY